MDSKKENIKMVSYNCRSIKRSIERVRALFREAHIILLQETLLLQHDLDFVQQIDEDFDCFAKSSVDTSAGVLRGRPYGGLALLWRKAVFKNVTIVECPTDRLAAIRLDLENNRQLLVINVYMPTDKEENLVEFTNNLANIMAIIDDNETESTYVLGDFIAHYDSRFGEELNLFCAEHSLVCVDYEMLERSTYTYVSEANGVTRWLDHCLATGAAQQTVRSVNVLHDVEWSDHSPLSITCNFDVVVSKIITNEGISLVNKVKWGQRNPQQIIFFDASVGATSTECIGHHKRKRRGGRDKLLNKLEENEPELATSPEEECVICVNAKATMQTSPCGHRVVCRRCFVKTIQMAVSQRLLPLRCVICRAKILRLRQTPRLVTSKSWQVSSGSGKSWGVPGSVSSYSVGARSVPASASLYSVTSGESSLSGVSSVSSNSGGNVSNTGCSTKLCGGAKCGGACLGAVPRVPAASAPPKPRQPASTSLRRSQHHSMKARLQDYQVHSYTGGPPAGEPSGRLPPIREFQREFREGRRESAAAASASTRIRCAQKIVTQLETSPQKNKQHFFRPLKPSSKDDPPKSRDHSKETDKKNDNPKAKPKKEDNKNNEADENTKQGEKNKKDESNDNKKNESSEKKKEEKMRLKAEKEAKKEAKQQAKEEERQAKLLAKEEERQAKLLAKEEKKKAKKEAKLAAQAEKEKSK